MSNTTSASPLLNAYSLAAQAHFQNKFIEEASEFLTGVAGADETRFFRAVWMVYQDRWPGPYSHKEIVSSEDFEQRVRKTLANAPSQTQTPKRDWTIRYDLDYDRLRRLSLQNLIDSKFPNRKGIRAFEVPYYDALQITEGGGSDQDEGDDDDDEEVEDGEDKDGEGDEGDESGDEEDEVEDEDEDMDSDCDVIDVIPLSRSES
ncbi:hypothetical protein BJ165DRAFT_1411089 [Panaeolus papilionaceus]|nr:hypothetical protein BJ165DRAFT_1411089 [Panaeolus papilionaceus]